MMTKEEAICPPSFLRYFQSIIDILLMPVSALSINRNSINFFKEAGIEFIGDLIQTREEKITISCKEREKIRKFLVESGLNWDCQLSPFLQYIYQCAKAYLSLKTIDEKQKFHLLITLLAGNEKEGDLHIKSLKSFDLSCLNPEEELAKKINEIARQIFSQIYT